MRVGERLSHPNNPNSTIPCITIIESPLQISEVLLKMLIITLLLAILSVLLAESTVLDPALYLAPSPPLVLTSVSIPPEELWLQTLEARIERVAREVAQAETTKEKPEAVVTGRMFWPRFSAPQPALGINIPLTFSLSGSYGKPAVSPAGVIGNTYTSITGLGSRLGGLGSSFSTKAVGSTASVYGNYGRSALAGSGYGTYGLAPSVRVYGGESAASWSGWGNGKWGHYGKG